MLTLNKYALVGGSLFSSTKATETDITHHKLLNSTGPKQKLMQPKPTQKSAKKPAKPTAKPLVRFLFNVNNMSTIPFKVNDHEINTQYSSNFNSPDRMYLRSLDNTGIIVLFNSNGTNLTITVQEYTPNAEQFTPCIMTILITNQLRTRTNYWFFSFDRLSFADTFLWSKSFSNLDNTNEVRITVHNIVEN